MTGSWVVLAFVVACWSAAYLVARAVARWLGERLDGPELAGTLRGLRRAGYVVVTVAALVGWRAVDGDGVVADGLTAADAPAVLGSPSAVAAVHAAVVVVALGSAWLGGVLAVALATVSYRRRAREYDLTHRFVVRWLLSRGGGSVAVVGVAVLVVSTVPAGVPRLAAVLALAAGTMLVLPYTLTVALRARPATTVERRVVADVLPEDVTLRVVDDRTRIGPAFAAGTPPGPEYVFVTGTVFDVCTDAAVRAVVAHEVAHHRHRHVAVRFATVLAGVLPVLAAVEFGLDLPAWTLLAGAGYVLATAWVFRWTEFTADAAAARAVGPGALVAAFDALVEQRLVLAGSTRTTSLFAVHPSIAARKRRLMAFSGENAAT
ncbi:M48 family metalloprotease [Halorubellus litoreus]|uniref:M48 family metalloprotease n=1 Tax=Halorubellus litoreus TaxID=755308 RepID=A0ABD5V855_9EURY